MNSTRLSVELLIRNFSLRPHPEGGFYAETHRSAVRITRQRDNSDRAASTAIYYLLSDGAYSAWHRIDSDEMWHFYSGSPLDIHILRAGSEVVSLRLGNALDEPGTAYQVLVPAGCWFGAELVVPDSYAFVGCTVAPGFEFSEFQLGGAQELLSHYPGHHALIERLAPRTL